MNNLMHMNDMKIFAKNEKKKLEAFRQTIKIYRKDIGIKVVLEMCQFIMKKKGGKRNRKIVLLCQDRIRILREKNTLEYKQSIPSNKHDSIVE